MLIPVLTLFVGALSTAAGIQELVVQGILNNQVIPLTGGTIGAVAGWPMTLLGLGWPIVLLFHVRSRHSRVRPS